MRYAHVQPSGLDPSKDVPVLVLLSGYPDTSDSWDRLTSGFQNSHHVVALNMPDYHKSSLSRFWGYSFADTVAALGAAIEPHYKRGSPVHLVGHDWGSYICQLYVKKFPASVSKLVLLDVGKETVTYTKDFKLVASLVRFSYMSWLAFCFIVSRLSSSISKVLINIYPWYLVGPCPYETDVPVPFGFFGGDFPAFVTYPYFQLFLNLGTLETVPFESCVPQLYLFGKRKRTNFHEDSYLEYLSQHNECSFKEFKNDGHWLHWTSPSDVTAEMQKFLF